MRSTAAKFEKILENLEREEKTRKDIVVSLSSIRMSNEGKFTSSEGLIYVFSDNAVSQMCALLKLPTSYVKKILYEVKKPELFASLINYHLQQKSADIKVKLRIKNGYVQGIVSEQYVNFDNYKFLKVFFETIGTSSQLNINHFHNNDKYMHIRVVYPEISHNYGYSSDGKKDIIHVGLDINNSETGHSAVSIQPVVYRVVCSNGMKAWVKSNDFVFYQRHIHFNISEFKNELKFGIESCIDQGRNMLLKIDSTRSEKIDNPKEKIEELGKINQLTKNQIKEIQLKFIDEPEMSMYGVLNAFTAYARDVKSLETRLEVEMIAGRILQHT